MFLAAVTLGRITPAIGTLAPRLLTHFFQKQPTVCTLPRKGIAVRSFSYFSYTHAITRELPDSFAEHSVKPDSATIQQGLAKAQFSHYLEILRQCNVEVITLLPDERFPDSVFVEDVAFVIGGTIVMLRPGLPSRLGEVQAVYKVLRGLHHELKIVEFDDPSARAEGGDIVFTGQEILIGESERSNKQAAQSLQRIFPEFPVTSIPVKGCLHLKSVTTLLQEDTLAIGGSKYALHIRDHIENKARGKYHFVQLENDAAANVMFFNNTIIMKPEKEIGTSDYKKLTDALTVPWKEVEFGEFYKANGCLSCCCLLVNKPSGDS